MDAAVIPSSKSSIGFIRLAAVLALMLAALSLSFSVAGPSYPHPELDIVGP
jgi:hypothetical protein